MYRRMAVWLGGDHIFAAILESDPLHQGNKSSVHPEQGLCISSLWLNQDLTSSPMDFFSPLLTCADVMGGIVSP